MIDMKSVLRKNRIILTTIVLLLLIGQAQGALKDRVKEATLDNGLKVILLENHRAPLVTFQVWYRVGSRNEEWGRTGLSHMLEHMMFKGTKRVGPEEFSKIIQENGGDDNAFTSQDFTAYFENISADKIGVAIDLESDRMQNLVLREEDFKTERMVVMEERRLRTDDNPSAYLGEQLEAAAFQVQPYHWPTIGWMQDLARFTLEDLKAYYRTYYAPSNAFLVVVGDFKTDEMLKTLTKSFGAIPGGAAPNQKRDREESQTGERRVSVKKEAQLPTIVMGYHVPNVADADSYALDVLSTILSGGKSSRFYRSLVQEKGLVFDIGAENSRLSRDPDLFYISADLLPGKNASDVEKAIDGEIAGIQEKLVEDRELEKAKNQIEASFIYSQDSIFGQALILARYEITSDWRKVDDYIPSIRQVTAEDIRRVVGKYLTPDNRTVGILVPLPPKEGAPGSQGPSGRGRIIKQEER